MVKIQPKYDPFVYKDMITKEIRERRIKRIQKTFKHDEFDKTQQKYDDTKKQLSTIFCNDIVFSIMEFIETPKQYYSNLINLEIRTLWFSPILFMKRFPSEKCKTYVTGGQYIKDLKKPFYGGWDRYLHVIMCVHFFKEVRNLFPKIIEYRSWKGYNTHLRFEREREKQRLKYREEQRIKQLKYDEELRIRIEKIKKERDERNKVERSKNMTKIITLSEMRRPTPILKF
jgi:hypothetical protein